MHTKHSHLLRIRTAAATLCAALFLWGCSYERIPDVDDEGGGEEGEPVTVTLKVDPASGEQTSITKGMTATQENTIQNLYILAFKPDETGTYKLKYYATGTQATGGSNGQFSFTLRRSASGAADTKLLLVANRNPYPLVNTGMTYEEVQFALTSVELTAEPAFADTGIPMFGFAGNSHSTALTITENMATPLSANLLRAVARIDVGVGSYENGVWNKGSVNFTLTEVHVFKPQNKYTLLPILNNLEYAGGTPSVTAPSPAGEQSTTNFEYTGSKIISNGNSNYCEAEIYIPEVLLKNGTVYDDNHVNRTALVIRGTYNNNADNYYRIDFTTVQTNVEGTALHDVLRNHIYRYSITNVSKPGYATAEAAYGGRAVGLTFTANVVDWQTGATGSPDPDMFVWMNNGGTNGTITQGDAGTVTNKTAGFQTDNGEVKSTLDYNTLLGEAIDNTYNGTGNGGLYRDVADAFRREGTFPKLVIAPDNASDAAKWRSTPKEGSPKNRLLDAKKACWDYRGQGRTGWRLPRLSELYLLWLNRETINRSKGFTSLGGSGVTYWSGSEGGQNDQAYTVNSSGEITLTAKSEEHSVRCVREVE